MPSYFFLVLVTLPLPITRSLLLFWPCAPSVLFLGPRDLPNSNRTPSSGPPCDGQSTGPVFPICGLVGSLDLGCSFHPLIFGIPPLFFLLFLIQTKHADIAEYFVLNSQTSADIRLFHTRFDILERAAGNAGNTGNATCAW